MNCQVKKADKRILNKVGAVFYFELKRLPLRQIVTIVQTRAEPLFLGILKTKREYTGNTFKVENNTFSACAACRLYPLTLFSNLRPQLLLGGNHGIPLTGLGTHV